MRNVAVECHIIQVKPKTYVKYSQTDKVKFSHKATTMPQQQEMAQMMDKQQTETIDIGTNCNLFQEDAEALNDSNTDEEDFFDCSDDSEYLPSDSDGSEGSENDLSDMEETNTR